GNSGKNILDGGKGADILSGLGGNDRLIGGAGKDTMTGGGGNDVFVFGKLSDSGKGAKADVITDFDDSGNDKIDLSALFGPKMKYMHDGAFTGLGQVRINDVAGPDLIVQVNTTGSLDADFEIRLLDTTLASMGIDDFVL